MMYASLFHSCFSLCRIKGDSRFSGGFLVLQADHLKYVDKLKKENERALGKIKLLLKSCKQLEEEKKMLQKELSQLEAAQKQNTGGCGSGKAGYLRQLPVSARAHLGVRAEELFLELCCEPVFSSSSLSSF